MKRYVSLFTLGLFLAFLSSLFMFMEVDAQIDNFTFFIPYYDDILDDQFDEGFNAAAFIGHPSTPFDTKPNLINDPINSTISIAVQREDTIIYYDHWEDGLEANIVQPTQSTTEVWGDGDPSNGSPPGIPSDILGNGSVIVLQNQVSLPRDTSQILYDGGDKLSSAGSNISVVRAAWPYHDAPPDPTIETLFAGAWELYPTQRWGTEYTIPVGEDISHLRGGFSVVGLNVQAIKDGTTVDIDLGGDGTVEYPNVTLNEGEQFTLYGDQAGLDPNKSVTVGTTVKSTNGQPIQVHTFTADPTSNWEARAYTIVPDSQWTDNYVAPRGSDGDFWLYNPHDTPLTIDVITKNLTAQVIVPPKTVTSYIPSGFHPETKPANRTGVNFRSTDGRNFYGLAALDSAQVQDWGYTILPEDNLTTQVLVGWGVSSIDLVNGAGDESRVYVTALKDTTIYVDYGDGNPPTAVPINALREVSIIDPNDKDMTGAYLYTEDGTPFVAVWGQDLGATGGFPSIDVGTGIVPLPALAIRKEMTLIQDEDGTLTPTWGDVVQFQLQAYNNTRNVLKNGIIADNIPSTVEYVPNTTRIRGNSAPDDSPPRTLFPFDEGGRGIGEIQPLEIVTVTFNVTLTEGIDTVDNKALIIADDVPPPEEPEISVKIWTPRYEMDKKLIDPADGIVTPGQVVTYGLVITSTGNLTITKLPVGDDFDERYLSFVRAEPFNPDIIQTDIITWSDLATGTRFGPLPRYRTIVLTTVFIIVNPIPPEAVDAINIAAVVYPEGEGGVPMEPQDDDEVVIFTTPTPSPTATAMPTPTTFLPTSTPSPIPSPTATTPPDDNGGGGGGDDDDDPTSTPGTISTPPAGATSTPPAGATSTPPAGATSTPPAGATSTPPAFGTTSGFQTPPVGGTSVADAGAGSGELPVTYLPETGVQSSSSELPWVWIVLAGVIGWIVYRYRK